MGIVEWASAVAADGATTSVVRCAAFMSTDAITDPTPFRIRHMARSNRGSRCTKRILAIVYGGQLGSHSPDRERVLGWRGGAVGVIG